MMLQKDLISGMDWDVMIVLDACRFDTFEKLVSAGQLDILGQYSQVDSQALHTAMWYNNNWKMENDVNLISGHGILWLEEFSIHKRFKRPYGFFDKNRKDWIYPEKNFKKLLEYQDLYPNEKFLVHIIPPHLPFLGRNGKKFMQQLDVINPHTTEGEGNMTAYEKVTSYGNKNGWDIPKVMYMENLAYAFEWIEKFIDLIQGKVVITADHGELLGEGGVYGHNEGFEEILRSVPWFEVRR